MRDIVIIGNGISGVTAARFIRKRSDAAITIVSSESPYFISRTALMYAYMGQIRYEDLKPYPDSFWARNRITLIQAHAIAIRTKERVVELASGEHLSFDTLILATGSRPNRFGWQGEFLPGAQGLYSMQDLASLEQHSKEASAAVVVGGGLIGVELVEMFLSRGIHVTFLVREEQYMEYLFAPTESEMIWRHIKRHGVDLRLGTEVKRIIPGDDGRVAAVETTAGDRIDATIVGLAVGVHPNADLAVTSDIDTNRGILVDSRFQTSEEGIYAIGDCAEFREDLENGRRIEQLWYSGRAQGRRLGLNLTGESRPYAQDVFYNSAKFFDLEYHTYGTVPPTLSPKHNEVIYRDPLKEQLLRIVYIEESHEVIGFNSLGVRLSQEVCVGWIRSGVGIEHVIDRLKEADFGEEFSRSINSEVIGILQSQLTDIRPVLT